MKITYFLWLMLLLCSVLGGCEKQDDRSSASVFVKLFPSDTSYQTGGAFQLSDGNFIVYGFSPEDNQLPPIIIKTDPHGTILSKKYMPSYFHYCTIKPTTNNTLMIAGVGGASSDTISVREMNNQFDSLKEINYPVTSVKSGPLI